jgi:hypothetical protein
MRDPDLLSARSEVALLHVRIKELTRQLRRAGDSSSHWANLKATYEQLEKAARSGNHETVKASLARIGEIIKAGAKTEAVWRDLTVAIEDKTRVATRENQRMKDLHQMMTVEQSMRLVGSLVLAVQKHVQDRRIQNAIGREISMVLAADGGFKPMLPAQAAQAEQPTQQEPGAVQGQAATGATPTAPVAPVTSPATVTATTEPTKPTDLAEPTEPASKQPSPYDELWGGSEPGQQSDKQSGQNPAG